MAGYKGYSRIEIRGTQNYVTRTTACLDVINAIDDGRKILESICARVHIVSIQDTNTGNACRAMANAAFPVLPLAIRTKNITAFKDELNASVAKAKRGALTLEHLGRQLAIGLTPGTYRSADNVVRPSPKTAAPAGASGNEVMFYAGLQTAEAMTALQDLMSGKRTVNNLPAGWDYELPRLLRNYLTPGSGAASEVYFNPTKTFHCEQDAAMHQRPPAVGLAHELIHALHNSSGVNLALVTRHDQNVEEIITTGMPPYNFEELSDNKLRTQWPTNLELRENYTITGAVRSVSV